jgi:hypothetical protein
VIPPRFASVTRAMLLCVLAWGVVLALSANFARSLDSFGVSMWAIGWLVAIYFIIGRRRA